MFLLTAIVNQYCRVRYVSRMTNSLLGSRKASLELADIDVVPTSPNSGFHARNRHLNLSLQTLMHITQPVPS